MFAVSSWSLLCAMAAQVVVMLFTNGCQLKIFRSTWHLWIKPNRELVECEIKFVCCKSIAASWFTRNICELQLCVGRSLLRDIVDIVNNFWHVSLCTWLLHFGSELLISHLDFRCWGAITAEVSWFSSRFLSFLVFYCVGLNINHLWTLEEPVLRPSEMLQLSALLDDLSLFTFGTFIAVVQLIGSKAA